MSNEVVERPGETDPAKVYSNRLKALFDQTGALRKELAEHAGYHPSVITRFFNGQRIAPGDFLPKFRAFLTERGHPISDEEFEDLDSLRKSAQIDSKGYSDQLAHSRDRIAELESEVERLTERLRGQRESAEDCTTAELDDIASQVSDEYTYLREHTDREHEGHEDALSQKVLDELAALRSRVEELQNVAHDTAVHIHHTHGPTGVVQTTPAKDESSGCLGCLGLLAAFFVMFVFAATGSGLGKKVADTLPVVPELLLNPGLPVLLMVVTGLWLRRRHKTGKPFRYPAHGTGRWLMVSLAILAFNLFLGGYLCGRFGPPWDLAAGVALNVTFAVRLWSHRRKALEKDQ